MKLAKPSSYPQKWNKTAVQYWQTEQPEKAVQCLINELNQCVDVKPKTLLLQLSFYLFNLGDYASATAVLQQGLVEHPTDTEILLNLAVCLGKQNLHEQAIKYARQLVEIEPNNFVAWDTLAASHAQQQEFIRASHAGTMALLLKDKAHGQSDLNWDLPLAARDDFTRHKTSVISFSLWGDNPTYLRGALRNTLLSNDLFPDWTIRFYLDATVPADFIALLTKLGAEVLIQPSGQTLKDKLCWRFKVANDDKVGLFLIRDADSVISIREVNAVNAWLTSDRWFHVIRDWWTHTDLILAGMWGGVAGVLPDLGRLLQTYSPPAVETAHIDQWFLRDKVWRYIRNNCLIHDRCFNHYNSCQIPGPSPSDDFHVGCNEKALASDWQSRWLGPWLEQYPCLGEPSASLN